MYAKMNIGRVTEYTNNKYVGLFISVNLLKIVGGGAAESSYMIEKSIGTKMNDHDLRLKVVSRSCQPLRYILR